MSAIFQEIQEAEQKAKEEIIALKSSLQESKISAVQKSKDLLSDAKKDADSSFSNKVLILEKELLSKQEESVSALQIEIDSFSKKSEKMIEKGISFLFSRLV